MRFPVVWVLFVMVLCFPDGYGSGLKTSNSPDRHPSESYQIEDYSKLILDELSRRKIIMLCDAYHGHLFFMNHVTGFLHDWLDAVENTATDTIPRKLILFLESNEETILQVNRFIDSGDISAFLKYYIEYDSHAGSNLFSIDYCIFMHALRAIKDRIEAFNKTSKSAIDLKICGAETDPPYGLHEIVEMTPDEFQKRKLRYFAFERDPLTADNIRAQLDRNPGYKGIVFYGQSHLLRGAQDKNMRKDIIPEKMISYYLVHYLDSLYTRDRVCLFMDNPVFDAAYQKVDRLESASEQPDYVVSVKCLPNHPVKMVFSKSKTYFNALYSLIKQYEDKETRADRMIYQKLVMTFTESVFHTYLNTEIENRDDVRSAAPEVLKKADLLLERYDAVESFQKCDEGLTLNIMPGNFYTQELVGMLSNIPIFKIDFLGTGALEKGRLSENTIQRIHAHQDDIAVYLAIHNLFAADENESRRIMEFLKQKLGFDYNTKFAWLHVLQDHFQ